MLKVKPEHHSKSKHVGSLSKQTEHSQLAQVRDQGQEEQWRQKNHQKCIFRHIWNVAGQVFGDENEVGATETNLGDQQAAIDDVSAHRSKGSEPDITVGEAISNAGR